MVHAMARKHKRKAGIPEDPDLLLALVRRSECRHFDMETKGIELRFGDGQNVLTDQPLSGLLFPTGRSNLRTATPLSDRLMF
jgi:hypothetical protein